MSLAPARAHLRNVASKPAPGVVLDHRSIATGMIACYLFNEGAGQFAQNAVQEYAGATLAGGAKWGHGGISFTGTGQKVTGLTPVLGSGDFTADAICNLDVLPGASAAATVMHTDTDSGTDGFELVVGGVSLAFQGWLPSAYVIGTTVVKPGVRYHVCLTRLRGVVTLYVNGNAEASASLSGVASAGNPLTIGYFSPTLETFRWQGAIEIARLWNRGLTAAEVFRLAQEPYAMFLPAGASRMQWPQTRQVSVSESFALSDSRALTITKAVAESFSLSDARAFTLTKLWTETLGLSDARALTLTKVVSEAFSLSDARALTFTKALSETLGLSDTATVILALKVLAVLTGYGDNVDLTGGIG